MRKTISISELRAGDIIAFCPINGSWLGRLIAAMTWPPGPPPFCHMAIAAPYEGDLSVYESTSDPGLGNCLDAGEIVSGVQVHGLRSRLLRHLIDRKGEAYVLPMTHKAKTDLYIDGSLTAEVGIADTCKRLLGIPYDYRMAPAARSYLLGWTRFLRGGRRGSAKRLFCSEFTTLVMQQLGLLVYEDGGLIYPEKYNPKGAARLYVKRGICGKPRKLKLGA